MKKIVSFILFISISVSLHAQTSDEQSIRELMAMQTTAWNNGDIDGFMKTYWRSDSLLFIGKSGPTYGWQSTLENYKKRYPDTTAMGKLKFDLLQLKPLSREYYFVLGQWHLTRSIGDIGGFFTLLFRKVNGKWLIIADHTS